MAENTISSSTSKDLSLNGLVNGGFATAGAGNLFVGLISNSAWSFQDYGSAGILTGATAASLALVL